MKKYQFEDSVDHNIKVNSLKVGQFCLLRDKSFIVLSKRTIRIPRRPRVGEVEERDLNIIQIYYVTNRKHKDQQHKHKTYSFEAFNTLHLL